MSLEEQIEEAAKSPAMVQSDGQTVQAQPLRDQIEADRYLEAKKASKKATGGLRFTKLVPPGAP